MKRYNLLARMAAKLQSDLETELGEKIASGEIKTGSVEWREYCDRIEEAAAEANFYSVRYEENN